MPVPVFKSRTKGGKLFITEHEKFVSYLHSLPLETETIVRERGKKTRSDSQNKYYWSVVINLFSAETGYSKNESHETLKSLFLTEKAVINTIHGDKIIDVTKSTTSLNTKEMEQYLDSIRGFCASELGLNVPEPNETD